MGTPEFTGGWSECDFWLASVVGRSVQESTLSLRVVSARAALRSTQWVEKGIVSEPDISGSGSQSQLCVQGVILLAGHLTLWALWPDL